MDNQEKIRILISFGGKLRELRLAKGFTQEQLANELGVEISQISRIERGVINTSVTTLYAISKTLKIDVSQLFLLTLFKFKIQTNLNQFNEIILRFAVNTSFYC